MMMLEEDLFLVGRLNYGLERGLDEKRVGHKVIWVVVWRRSWESSKGGLVLHGVVVYIYMCVCIDGIYLYMCVG